MNDKIELAYLIYRTVVVILLCLITYLIIVAI